MVEGATPSAVPAAAPSTPPLRGAVPLPRFAWEDL